MLVLFVFAMLLYLVPSAIAGTEKVLYAFKGGKDGETPVGSLVADAQGNLYGVTQSGGAYGIGTVFKLTHVGSGWKEEVLHTFGTENDGANPNGVIVDDAGNLYGTTTIGGGVQQLCPAGCGTVFMLTSTSGEHWKETVIHRFQPSKGDGANPYSALVRNKEGVMYGTTLYGGAGACHGGCGTVFVLRPIGKNHWTERVLYSFQGGSDGAQPYPGVTFDRNGDMYGTTYQGGSFGQGTVYQVTLSGGQWVEAVLYSFGGSPDGSGPGDSPVIFDKAGDIYGTTAYGGSPFCDCGTVFELQRRKGGWSESILHSFSGRKDGKYPFGPTTSGKGDLYGTTTRTVFELIPVSGKKWKETVLYEFQGGKDGNIPSGGLISSTRALYGLAAFGGDLSCGSGHGCGVVFEVSR